MLFRSYRTALDELDLNEEQRESLLEEARMAFGFNSGVFTDLAKRHCAQ